MSVYTPDSWKIVEINSEEYGQVFKVLASWYGGFAGSNSWKLSSGIEGVELVDGVYVMPQTSGSTYMCHEKSEHVSGLIGGVFSGYARKAEESKSFTIKMIDMQQFLEQRQ